jgi:hypothetical protein
VRKKKEINKKTKSKESSFGGRSSKKIWDS